MSAKRNGGWRAGGGRGWGGGDETDLRSRDTWTLTNAVMWKVFINPSLRLSLSFFNLLNANKIIIAQAFYEE